MSRARGGHGGRALLSAVATIALLVLALGFIRAGLGPGVPAERRWTFLEEEPPEALGLVVEVPAAGVWTVAPHDRATGARALVSAAGNPDAKSGLVIAPDTRSADALVSTRCRGANRAGRACGVVLRHASPGSFYLARVDDARGVLEIVRSVGGVETPLASSAVRAHAGWYAIELEARGDALRALVDGGQPLGVRDGALTEGTAGLWAPADAEAYFDELGWRALRSDDAHSMLPFFQLGS